MRLDLIQNTDFAPQLCDCSACRCRTPTDEALSAALTDSTRRAPYCRTSCERHHTRALRIVRQRETALPVPVNRTTPVRQIGRTSCASLTVPTAGVVPAGKGTRSRARNALLRRVDDRRDVVADARPRIPHLEPALGTCCASPSVRNSHALLSGIGPVLREWPPRDNHARVCSVTCRCESGRSGLSVDQRADYSAAGRPRARFLLGTWGRESLAGDDDDVRRQPTTRMPTACERGRIGLEHRRARRPSHRAAVTCSSL